MARTETREEKEIRIQAEMARRQSEIKEWDRCCRCQGRGKCGRPYHWVGCQACGGTGEDPVVRHPVLKPLFNPGRRLPGRENRTGATEDWRSVSWYQKVHR